MVLFNSRKPGIPEKAAEALGRLRDKRATLPLLKWRNITQEALASLVSKPYYNNHEPSIYEILIEDIDAALAQLQA